MITYPVFYSVLSVLIKKLSGKSVPEMKYFVSSGTLAIKQVFVWFYPRCRLTQVFRENRLCLFVTLDYRVSE